MSHVPFSNSAIVPVRPGKPHIKFVRGYWRVSVFNFKRHVKQSEVLKNYADAYTFINRLNYAKR